MGPEALTGDIVEGAASLLDVYAVGVLAYELLCGIAPFDGADARDLYRAKMRKPVPSVAWLRPDVPPALDDLVAQLIAPDPQERPQGAEAVLWQLRALRTRVSAAPEARPFSVLIVDDDEDMRRMLALYVRAAAAGAEIEATGEGRQAIRAVRRRVPDLLLVDLDLPDINGIEVCMLLRGMRLGDGCLIVSVSSRATQADVELLHQLGVRSLQKGPELVTQLAEIVERIRPGH
jgi:CheY-like chemotaxis protein